MNDSFPFHPKKIPTVIVAEDSPTQALNLEELLENAGMRVIWAKNGVECIQWAEQVQPDLVLLDLEMPEMNGIQTCQALKIMPATANVPIIIFTKHEDPEFARLSFQSGAVDYIPKDAFANAVLLETLRELGFISKPNQPGSESEE